MPFLQLDIEGGYYVDPPEETIFAANSSFTLYALLNLTWNQFQPDMLVENSYPFYTSAAHFRAERPRLSNDSP